MRYRIKFKALDVGRYRPSFEQFSKVLQENTNVKPEHYKELYDFANPKKEKDFQVVVDKVREIYKGMNITRDNHTKTNLGEIAGVYGDLLFNEHFTLHFDTPRGSVELDINRNEGVVDKYTEDGRNHFAFTRRELELFDRLGLMLGDYRMEKTGESIEDWYEEEGPRLIEVRNIFPESDGVHCEITSKEMNLPIGTYIEFESYDGYLHRGIIVKQYDTSNYRVEVE